MATETDLIAEIKKTREYLEQMANKPASSVSPNVVFGGANPYDQHKSHEWPMEQLKAIGEAYGTPAAVNMFCKRHRDGRPRATGFGPALVKLAALASGQTGARQLAVSQGLLSDAYGLEQLEKEHGFYPATQSRVIKTPYGEVRKTALAEGSGQTGGYVVPPQFMNELLTIAAEDGFIEQRAKVLPMNSRTAQWPMLDITTAQSSGTSPYFGGILAQWQPEAATINETEPQFKQSEWTAWDLVLYTVSSNQLLADNGIGLDALLTQLFGQAITWYKEFAYLQGKGAGSTMPLGIINAPATYSQTRAKANRFLFADVAAMMSHLQIRSWDDACWIMHQSVIPQLMQMVDGGTAGSVAQGSSTDANSPTGNRLVWLNPTMTGDRGPAGSKMPNAFFNGLPLFFTEKLPSLGSKGDVMLVDFSRYVIGMRLDMQIDVSPHFLFRNNQLAWRVIARADGKPWLNNVITDQTGWQISPFVILN